jgi:hypothetical protein
MQPESGKLFFQLERKHPEVRPFTLCALPRQQVQAAPYITTYRSWASPRRSTLASALLVALCRVAALDVWLVLLVDVQPANDNDKETMITSEMATAAFFIILFVPF